MMKSWILLATLCSLSYTVSAYGEGLTISLVTDGNYSILVNNVTWLTSSHISFSNEGKVFSTEDGSLKLLNTSMTSGYDIMGQWQSISYFHQGGTMYVEASIKTYNYPNWPVAIFTQRYYSDVTGASQGDPQKIISRFPSFKLQKSPTDLGYMAYGDDMSGWDGLTFDRWGPTAYVPTGIKGGPLVLFDNSSNAMVISPFSQFMAASSHIDFMRDISWGIMGLVDSVPYNYSIDFILYYSDQGINDAMRGWGQFLQYQYQKNSLRRDSDVTLQYMGYWTDNGAYYYYDTEEGKNYEETMVDAVKDFEHLQIPFKYMQYDSWWYPKGHREGTLTWVPKKDIFPDGFKYVAEQTKLPFGCHNRYWDSETTYAKYNGGKYNFIEDKFYGVSVPDDEQFWLDLFNQTKEWGNFVLYEQDWLNWENDQNSILLSDLFMGRRWLMGMAKGADAYNINIQYCMAYSRHILQSVEIPAVTQARVSEDYSPGGKQWNIGITSMFTDALNVAPSKDTFWTSEVQPGNKYQGKERHTALQHIIATLSTGPVGPGDGIGYINKTLLMRCCDATGQILKPYKAATAINDQIKKLAFENYPGPNGEVYTTYTNITNLIFGIVLAADMQNDYNLTPSAGWLFTSWVPSMIYSGTEPLKIPRDFKETKPLQLGPQCTPENFCLFYTSPVLHITNSSKSVVLMGESDKWVPLSSQRVRGIVQKPDDVEVELRVQAGEVVTFNYYFVGEQFVRTIRCDNSNGASSQDETYISVADESCYMAP